MQECHQNTRPGIWHCQVENHHSYTQAHRGSITGGRLDGQKDSYSTPASSIAWQSVFHCPVLTPCQVLCQSHAWDPRGMPSSWGSAPLTGILQRSEVVPSIHAHSKWNIHHPRGQQVTHFYLYRCLVHRHRDICSQQAYHVLFPSHFASDEHPICHLEAMNVVAELKTCAGQLPGSLLPLYTDNATAAAIFKRGRDRDYRKTTWVCGKATCIRSSLFVGHYITWERSSSVIWGPTNGIWYN